MRDVPPRAPLPVPRPLRVLHIHTGNLYGGIESVLTTYAAEIAGAGAGRMEFTFALSFEDRLAAELREAGAHVVPLGAARIREPLAMLRARRRLRALLRAKSFDVALLHSSWSQALFGGVVRRAGIPLAFYMHGPAGADHWLDRLASRTRPDFVLYNSLHTRTEARLFAQVPGAVLHYPLSPRPRGAFDREALRRALGAATEDVVIVQASRLDEWKGHRLHLEALARLRTSRPWRAWFAGGPQRPSEQGAFVELQARARELGIGDRVAFLGQRSDVPQLLGAADVFCQPNTGPEPFGLVFVEALRAGLPVVATAMGGALEIVDASCGLLTPASPDAVASALASLVEDAALRARLGGAGPARVRALVDPSRQLEELERHLRAMPRRS